MIKVKVVNLFIKVLVDIFRMFVLNLVMFILIVFVDVFVEMLRR